MSQKMPPWLVVAGLGAALLLWLGYRTRTGQNVASGLLTFAESAVQKASETGQLVMGWFDSLKGLLQRFEGLSLTAYQDIAGRWTIGYGHLVQPGEPYVPYGSVTTITQQEADDLLQRDSQIASDCVAANVTVTLSDPQRAALVSFVYNVGCGAFQSSTLLSLLNSGDYAGAQAQFDVWNKARDPTSGQLVVNSGLANRRSAEQALFASGTASA